MIKISFICLLLFTSLISITTINGENLPVFLWGETSTYSPALKKYESNEFSDFVESQIDDSTVTIVFTENTLSVEDLSSCKKLDGTTCFENLESKTSKTYLPFVSDPMPTLKKLAESKKQVIANLNADGTLSPVDLTEGSFLFVSMNDLTLNENKVEVFSRHDKLIENIVTELSKKFKILSIYTGNHTPLEITHSRKIRQAAQIPPKADDTIPSNATFFDFGNGRVYMIYNKITEGETEVVMTLPTVVNETDNSVSIELSGNGKKLGMTLTMAYGNWNLASLTWGDQNLHIRTPISIAYDFSYHCAQAIQFYTSDKKTIKIEGIQFQPSFGKDSLTKFGDSWDCVGFTSGGIWAGLFITFILLFILSIGLSWMMDIRTMDKFDDPKGKTITVNVTE